MKLGKNKLARILHKFKQKFSLDYRKNLWLKISKKKKKNTQQSQQCATARRYAAAICCDAPALPRRHTIP